MAVHSEFESKEHAHSMLAIADPAPQVGECLAQPPPSKPNGPGWSSEERKGVACWSVAGAFMITTNGQSP